MRPMIKMSYLCKKNQQSNMLTQFKQYLANKGITPSTTDIEEQLMFLLDNLYYLFIFDKSDPNYFRLILPNIFKIEGEKAPYENLVNNLNQKFKVAKTVITEDGMIWTSAEQFVYSNEGSDFLFERCVVLLKLVTEQLRDSIKDLNHD